MVYVVLAGVVIYESRRWRLDENSSSCSSTFLNGSTLSLVCGSTYVFMMGAVCFSDFLYFVERFLYAVFQSILYLSEMAFSRNAPLTCGIVVSPSFRRRASSMQVTKSNFRSLDIHQFSVPVVNIPSCSLILNRPLKLDLLAAG